MTRARVDRRKQCTGCRLELPLDEFGRDARSSDGRRSKCKRCQRARPPHTYRDPDEIFAEGNALLLYRWRLGLGLYRSDFLSRRTDAPPAAGGVSREPQPAVGTKHRQPEGAHLVPQHLGKFSSPDPAVRPTSRGTCSQAAAGQ